MEFNNYCLLILGNVEKVEDTLKTITEKEIKFVVGKGFFISTFLSLLTPEEIKNCFCGEESSVIVFNLSSEYSSVELSDKDRQDYLFKEIFENGQISNILTENYNSMLRFDREKNDSFISKRINYKVDDMDKETIKKMINEIIDKGVENLTKEDKELLDLLTKQNTQ